MNLVSQNRVLTIENRKLKQLVYEQDKEIEKLRAKLESMRKSNEWIQRQFNG